MKIGRKSYPAIKLIAKISTDKARDKEINLAVKVMRVVNKEFPGKFQLLITPTKVRVFKII